MGRSAAFLQPIKVTYLVHTDLRKKPHDHNIYQNSVRDDSKKKIMKSFLEIYFTIVFTSTFSTLANTDQTCPNDCSLSYGFGKCNTATGECDCDDGFFGDDCSEYEYDVVDEVTSPVTGTSTNLSSTEDIVTRFGVGLKGSVPLTASKNALSQNSSMSHEEIDKICGRRSVDRTKRSADAHRSDTSILEHPWTTLILRNNVLHCGGAIVSKKHIVTAAHCVVDLQTHDSSIFPKNIFKKEFKIVLGTDSLENIKDGRSEIFEIQSVEVHKEYKYLEGIRGYYDIAVVTLSSEIKFNEYRIQPICLPKTPYCEQAELNDKVGAILGYADGKNYQLHT